MFRRNKYKRWYDAIIENARKRGSIAEHTERHHILPLSLGGTNRKDNLVILTFREHFLAHWLLTKFVIGNRKHAVHRALACMALGPAIEGRKFSSWHYATARGAIREAGFSVEHRRRLSEVQKGKPRSPARQAALAAMWGNNRGNPSKNYWHT